MLNSTDHNAVLARIADLATRASNQHDLPASLKATLAEIAELAGGATRGDTPEASDIAATDNQSL